MVKPAKMTTRLYTSAPEVYDGFGTRTLAVVGECLRSHNPVRVVDVESEHLNWQVSRYDSGSHRHTAGRCKLDDWSRFGDWLLHADAAEWESRPEVIAKAKADADAEAGDEPESGPAQYPA